MSDWRIRLKRSMRKARTKATGGSMTICATTTASMLMISVCCVFAGPGIYVLL